MVEYMQLQPKKFVLNNDNMKKYFPKVMIHCQAEQNKTQEANALDKNENSLDLKA